MTGRIIWLASFPKSGNTWVRVFLTSYLSGGDEPASINNLVGPIASSRRIFDDLAGIEASDLTASEIARHRADVYRMLASEATQNLFLKVHDAASVDGYPIVPKDDASVAIYIVRNPLDVVVSLANHLEQPIEVAVDHVCNGLILAGEGRKLKPQLEQVVLSWGEHVRAWLDDPDRRVECVRYEDLITDAAGSFSGILRAIGEVIDEPRLARAIGYSSFGNLQVQEQEHGFSERSSTRTPFFRSGRVNQWRDLLSNRQVERIVAANRDEMKRFSYLP